MNVNIRFHKDSEKLVVERWQDVEPYIENSKEQQKLPNPKGDKFWPKWSLPPIEIIKFYDRYAAGDTFNKPMNQEFWEWVDKQVMGNSDYAFFRTSNPSNPFKLGWR